MTGDTLTTECGPHCYLQTPEPSTSIARHCTWCHQEAGLPMAQRPRHGPGAVPGPRAAAPDFTLRERAILERFALRESALAGE